MGTPFRGSKAVVERLQQRQDPRSMTTAKRSKIQRLSIIPSANKRGGLIDVARAQAELRNSNTSYKLIGLYTLLDLSEHHATVLKAICHDLRKVVEVYSIPITCFYEKHRTELPGLPKVSDMWTKLDLHYYL